MHQSYINAVTEYLEVIRDPEIGCEHTVVYICPANA